MKSNASDVWRLADHELPHVGVACEVRTQGGDSVLLATFVRRPDPYGYCWANGEQSEFYVHGVVEWRYVMEHPERPSECESCRKA